MKKILLCTKSESEEFTQGSDYSFNGTWVKNNNGKPVGVKMLGSFGVWGDCEFWLKFESDKKDCANEKPVLSKKETKSDESYAALYAASIAMDGE